MCCVCRGDVGPWRQPLYCSICKQVTPHARTCTGAYVCTDMYKHVDHLEIARRVPVPRVEFRWVPVRPTTGDPPLWPPAIWC